jgi:predicted RNase H-like HicB family nuclease
MITLNISLPIKVMKRRRPDVYQASCTILDVHSQGTSEQTAKKNLKEALSLFFASCIERGTLDAVLKDCGFAPVITNSGTKRSPSTSKKGYVNVPLPLIAESRPQYKCRE